MENTQDVGNARVPYMLVEDDIGTNGDYSGVTAELKSWRPSAWELGDIVNRFPELAIPCVCRYRSSNRSEPRDNAEQVYPGLR
jgi:hypothetical protein